MTTSDFEHAVLSAVTATDTVVGVAFRHFIGKSQFAWCGRAAQRGAPVWPRLGRFLLGRHGVLAVPDLRESSDLPEDLARDLVALGMVSVAAVSLRDHRGVTSLAVLDIRPRDFEPAIAELLEGILGSA